MLHFPPAWQMEGYVNCNILDRLGSPHISERAKNQRSQFKNKPGPVNSLMHFRVLICVHLNLWPPDPAHCWQLPLQEKMIGLIVEAPLADGQVCPLVLHLQKKQQIF